MLLKLVSNLPPRDFQIQVISVSGDGPLGNAFRATGVRLDCIESMFALYDPARLVKIARVLQRFRPDLVQGWMYHGNTAASLACFWGRVRVPVLWNVRGSNAVSEKATLLGRLNYRLSTFLAGGVTWIVNNSLLSAQQHEKKLSYPLLKRVIVPNGFDLQKFRPDAVARQSTRLQLAIPCDGIVIGYVGRDHADKDVSNFVCAARSIVETHGIQRDVIFVLAGEGLIHGCRYWQELDEPSRQQFRFIGLCSEVSGLLPAFDVLVLSSRRENFPNVLGEAMCCGVVVVTTEVGECAALVGSASLVVRPESPATLRTAILRIIRMTEAERQELGLRLRSRAAAEYSLDKIVDQYIQLYEQTSSRALPICVE